MTIMNLMKVVNVLNIVASSELFDNSSNKE